MSHLVRLLLPQRVSDRLLEVPWVGGTDARGVLETATSKMAEHIDETISSFEPLSLCSNLGFQVSYGLPAADEAAIRDETNTPTHRPPRYGLDAQSVGMAARVALERAVLAEQLGSRKPNELEIRDLVCAAAVYVEMDVLRDLASLSRTNGRLAMGTLRVRKTGQLLEVDFRQEAFDLIGYQQLRTLRVRDNDPVDLEAILAMTYGVPEELSDLSEAMVTDLGFELEDLLNVLVIGVRLNLKRQAQFLAVDVAHFQGELLPSVSPRALAAFEFLSFSSQFLSLTDLRPSGTRHQRRRVVTHPFLIRGGHLYLIRDIQFEALNRWLTYLLNGDWPVPPPARKKLWPKLDAAITRRRNARGTGAFEPFVESELDDIGLPWASTSGQGAQIASALITSEVDAIVVDPDAGLIWVLECKDVTSDQNLRSLQSELDHMLKMHGKQVTRTVAEVETDPSGVATHLVQSWARRRGPDPALQAVARKVAGVSIWRVKAVLVVRDRSAAEFLFDKPWDVVPVSGLRSLLSPHHAAPA